MAFLLDQVLDALLDTLKLMPLLFLTYLLMEWLEHASGDRIPKLIQKSGRFGPLIGAVFGVVPQCGFAGAMAGLFAGGVVSTGTLLAVFLSTSDEMLPILISEKVSFRTILPIIGIKLAVAVVAGFAVDLLWKRRNAPHIHDFCEQEHCDCEDGIWFSALKHTFKVAGFILLITLVLNITIGFVGEDTLSSLFSSLPVVGELAAGLIGLIPNCASSVLLTEIYLSGGIGLGALISGLSVNAGLGLLVLFRTNRRAKQNLGIVALLYAVGVIAGVLVSLTGLTL